MYRLGMPTRPTATPSRRDLDDVGVGAGRPRCAAHLNGNFGRFARDFEQIENARADVWSTKKCRTAAQLGLA